MADYISRDAAIQFFNDWVDDLDKQINDSVNYPHMRSDYKVCKTQLLDCIHAIKEMPTADVRLVVRAFWVGEMDGVGICSNCKRLDHIDPLATHCRYCGADMRDSNLDTTKGDNHD